MLTRLINKSIKLSKFIHSKPIAAYFGSQYGETLKHKNTLQLKNISYGNNQSHSKRRHFNIFIPSAALISGAFIKSKRNADESAIDPNLMRYISPGTFIKSDSSGLSSPESVKLAKPTFHQDQVEKKITKDSTQKHPDSSSKVSTLKEPEEQVSSQVSDEISDVTIPKQDELEDDFSDDEVTPLPDYISQSVPATFPDFVPYLIIGGGTTGMSAARAIRASDPTSQVLIISSEADISSPGSGSIEEFYPYIKPPLSKDLWRRNAARQAEMMDPKGDMKKHSWLYYESESFFLKPENLRRCTYGGIAFWKGRKVIGLDVLKREAILDNGHKVAYNQCLLATGSRPKRLQKFDVCSSSGADLVKQGKVSYFRSMNDFKCLQKLAQSYSEKGGRIAIIGGGFLGTELAMSLGRMAKKSDKLKILQVYRELGNYAHSLPPYLAVHTREYLEKNQVTVKHLSEVTDIRLNKDGKLTLNVVKTHDETQKETEIVDHVVVALGVEPNIDLAKSGNLEIDPVLGGYSVNSELEARSGVYVAGDAASYFDPLLGRRRVEHINHAEESGQIAGKNMAASCQVRQEADNSRVSNWSRTQYDNQSSFWSSLGPDLSFEAVGLIDARKLKTHAYLAFECEDYSDVTIDCANIQPNYEYPGVVFYTDPSTKIIVGVVLWNLPDEFYSDSKYFAPSRLNLARKLLADRIVVESEQQLKELAKDFDIYESVDDEFHELKKKMENRVEEEAKKLEAEHSNSNSN